MTAYTTGSPEPPPTGGTYTTGAIAATVLPVSDSPGMGYATLLRTVVPAEPGDVFDISAHARAINATGYAVVAVSYGLWMYDADDELPPEERPWTPIGQQREGSTDPVRTAVMMHAGDVYRVPAEWPAGHRMVIVHRADAYATDLDPEAPPAVLDVDTGYGILTLGRWLALR